MINRTRTQAPTRAAAYWAERGYSLPSTLIVRIGEPRPGRIGQAEHDCFGDWIVTIAPGWEHHWIVIAHEFGHVLGLEHDDPRYPIMAPRLSEVRR